MSMTRTTATRKRNKVKLVFTEDNVIGRSKVKLIRFNNLFGAGWKAKQHYFGPNANQVLSPNLLRGYTQISSHKEIKY